MIPRILSTKIKQLRNQFPVLMLTGPRQSGKTTLLRAIYTDLPYATLEDPDARALAIDDPRGFLSNFPHGGIFDEVQVAPVLFSYIQGIVDKNKIHFVLSGSQNFLLSEKITQSLAGRTSILKLLPFSFEELKGTPYTADDWETMVYQGGYPPLYDRQISPTDFFPSYINTYIERDVRQIKNIENLNSFSSFLKLCAGRIGQVLNVQGLAHDVGISPNTAKAWLSVLSASYIIFFIEPHHRNFNKRLIKSPKMYFYDTGVACSLLGIEKKEQLNSHFLKGGLFENYVVNEFVKHRTNQGKNPNISFWQSKDRKEIDLLIDRGDNMSAIEIKSGKTWSSSFFENLKYWQKLSGTPSEQCYIVYGGDQNLNTSMGKFVGWRDLNNVF